ncbi:hypothetical protein X801_06782 [Opisthorchis viverrini]|uniref:Uncharacterized protein n=1 Tax=Opisthorchis viverrini TaxID=6198 RepID=A0A1S8WS85_OPIVI|nr:hypothetical protein X801_06782 [Opisthorchis viverrini]
MPDPKDYTLEVLEAMFSNRYSTTDSGYKEHCAQPIPPPPVIPHWKARDNSPSRHGERSRQRSFRSAYDDRRNMERNYHQFRDDRP